MGCNGSSEKAPLQLSGPDPPPARSWAVHPSNPSTASGSTISFQTADRSKQTNTMSENSKVTIESRGSLEFQKATNQSEQINNFSGSAEVRIKGQ